MAHGKAIDKRGVHKRTTLSCNGAGTFSARLRSDSNLAGLILDHLNEGIALLDMQGRLIWANPALENMMGWTLEELCGLNPAALICPPDTRPDEATLAQFRYDPTTSLFSTYHVTRHIRRDGSQFWNQLSHALVPLGAGDDQKLVAITCRDISDQIKTHRAMERLKNELEHAAYHDALTGLGNRKKLSHHLRLDHVQAQVQAGHVGVLQLDLDKFKEINDTLGHSAGDATLIHVAQALTANTAPGDLACRTGGDEFLLICLNITDPSALHERAKNIMKHASRPFKWRDQMIHMGVSIGANIPDTHAISGEALIQQADQALYSAKNDGRGKVVFYTERLGNDYKARQDLNRELREAIEQKQFTVHLQPMLNLATDKIIGCEALLRWHHPTLGLLSPASFLSAAEQGQMLGDVDYLAMTAALDALVELREAGFPDMRVSLNVSGAVLADANYPGLLDWALQSRGLPADAICVEILETAFLDEGDLDAITAVERLRHIGVRVALDDFGTGYAGLAHMSALKIDAIKLDQSMIGRLEKDPRTRIITRSIIHLCALLKLDVVAEGVETQGQLNILRRARCPIIQGYGLAHPMPMDKLIRWLQVHSPMKIPVTMNDTLHKRPKTPPKALRD
ncbi:EAL domain-containing protein [Roseovarius aestuarii]|nr:EAL domain-containing protein [Roseovarius aestuarii]